MVIIDSINKIFDEYEKLTEKFSTIYVNNKPTTYKVSSLGYVINTNYRGTGTTKRMKEEINHGYKRTMIVVDGRKIHKRIHRLVAEAFIPNPDNKPYVNHIDGDKTNNRVSNLEWVTHLENVNHAMKTGLYLVGENHPNAKIDNVTVHKICRLLESGKYDVQTISNISEVSTNIIYSILFSNKNWHNISKNYNIHNYLRHNNKIPSDIINKICKLIEDGKTDAEISRTVDVTPDIIWCIRHHKHHKKISMNYNF